MRVLLPPTTSFSVRVPRAVKAIWQMLMESYRFYFLNNLLAYFHPPADFRVQQFLEGMSPAPKMKHGVTHFAIRRRIAPIACLVAVASQLIVLGFTIWLLAAPLVCASDRIVGASFSLALGENRSAIQTYGELSLWHR